MIQKSLFSSCLILVAIVIFVESKIFFPLKDGYDTVFSYNMKIRDNNRILWTHGEIHLRLTNNTIRFAMQHFEVNRNENINIEGIHKAADTPIYIELDGNENLPNSNDVDWRNLDPRVILHAFALSSGLFSENGHVNATVYDETNTFGGWAHCPPALKVREDDKNITLRLFFNNKKCQNGTIYDTIVIEDFLEVNYVFEKNKKQIIKIEAHFKDQTYVSETEVISNIEFIDFERIKE